LPRTPKLERSVPGATATTASITSVPSPTPCALSSLSFSSGRFSPPNTW
jgi:hypothetical protein